MRDEMEILGEIRGFDEEQVAKYDDLSSMKKKVIRICERWHENFQGSLSQRSHEGKISVEMCSHEFFLKRALWIGVW